MCENLRNPCFDDLCLTLLPRLYCGNEVAPKKLTVLDLRIALRTTCDQLLFGFFSSFPSIMFFRHDRIANRMGVDGDIKTNVNNNLEDRSKINFPVASKSEMRNSKPIKLKRNLSRKHDDSKGDEKVRSE